MGERGLVPISDDTSALEERIERSLPVAIGMATGFSLDALLHIDTSIGPGGVAENVAVAVRRRFTG